MNRRIRWGGITLLASLIGITAAASGAQAGNFSATEYPATLAGSQSGGLHEFYTPRWQTKCEEATLGGTLKEASSTLTVSPEYGKCGATTTLGGFYFFVATTVKMNGCTYTYHDNTTDSETVSTGTTTINCPEGKQIEYSFYEALVGESHAGKPVLCTLGVGPQGPLAGITYTNNPKAEVRDVLIKTSLKVVVKIVWGTVSSCGPLSGSFYSGSTTETAKNGKGGAISLSAG